MNFEITCGRWTTHDDGVETVLYVGKDDKSLIHILAGDKKTSLKQVPNRGYDTFEDDIDAALDECEEMIYSCISNGKR